MNQEYFVVVLAHSLRGRLRRVQIPHQAVYAILALAFFGCFSVFGFVASYARMVGKVANYNALKREADTLRARYQNLQSVASQTNQQLASLQLYAKEVSLAYGIKQKLEGPSDISAEGKLVPTFAESVRDYDFLKAGNALAVPGKAGRLLRPRYTQPSIWPVTGRLMLSPFGQRTDPFSGEGAFHTGVDISAAAGTPVRATADGIVVYNQFESGYGRLWWWITAPVSRPTTRISLDSSCMPDRKCGGAMWSARWEVAAAPLPRTFTTKSAWGARP